MKLIVISAGLAGAVGALAETARADTFIFSGDDFPDANWAIPDSVFMDPAQTGQRLAGGDPGAYRQLGLIFAERPDYAANLNLTFAYTPATQGAITGITYTFDLKAISAIGSCYYPLISQGGVLFYDPFAQAYNSESLWITYNLVLDPGQFVPLHVRSASPDFTTGSTITFGYLATTGGAGFYESVTGIDNDPITLTVSPVTSGVPEPGTFTLFGFGLLSLIGLRRRRPPQLINRFKDLVIAPLMGFRLLI
jgi:PEP-CTERM motif